MSMVLKKSNIRFVKKRFNKKKSNIKFDVESLMISNFTFSRFSSPFGLLINIVMMSVKAALFTFFDLLTGATTSTSDR